MTTKAKKPEEAKRKSNAGRPTNDPKTKRAALRLSEADLKKLNYCTEALNISAAEVIRLGIDKVYSELQDDSKKGSDNTDNGKNK